MKRDPQPSLAQLLDDTRSNGSRRHTKVNSIFAFGAPLLFMEHMGGRRLTGDHAGAPDTVHLSRSLRPDISAIRPASQQWNRIY